MADIFKAVGGGFDKAAENWVMASFGCSTIDNQVWFVTTNRVHCSEMPEISDLVPVDPKEMAEFLAEKLNEEYERRWNERHQLELNL